MPIVKVKAPEQASAYDIHIGHGLLKNAATLLAMCRGRRAMIVTDENVAPLYLDTLKAQLELAGAQTHAFILPAGETTKCMAQLERIYDALIDAHITRKDFVIALGGGVVGDITGYAACTYLRGVRFIQVPTTLLAQVDSSVGGKVAVNHPRGKNLLGAFYQPELVLIDCDTLRTLDARQVGAGLGEVIKYGCIADAALFDKLEQGQVIDHLEETICRCVLCKKHFVEEDTNDKGRRMILNFGHTFGHALEKLTGFSSLSHGLAVGIGMVMAGEVGESLGVTEKGTAARIRRVLESYGMPTESAFDFAKVVEATALDKKSFGKTLNLILLKQIGESVIHPVDRNYLVLRYKLAAEQNRRRKLN